LLKAASSARTERRKYLTKVSVRDGINTSRNEVNENKNTWEERLSERFTYERRV